MLSAILGGQIQILFGIFRFVLTFIQSFVSDQSGRSASSL